MINLEPGVILLEFTCYDGEVVQLLTGARVSGEISVSEPRSSDSPAASSAA